MQRVFSYSLLSLLLSQSHRRRSVRPSATSDLRKLSGTGRTPHPLRLEFRDGVVWISDEVDGRSRSTVGFNLMRSFREFQ